MKNQKLEMATLLAQEAEGINDLPEAHREMARAWRAPEVTTPKMRHWLFGRPTPVPHPIAIIAWFCVGIANKMRKPKNRADHSWKSPWYDYAHNGNVFYGWWI